MQVIRHLHNHLGFLFKNSMRYGEVLKSLGFGFPSCNAGIEGTILSDSSSQAAV